MNCIIPFESKVKFNNPVKEITSISLEHEITKNDDELLGNFIIDGTYKEHELSVNTEDFHFTLPFSVELNNRIDNDTLDFNIDNFTYEIDNDEMIVKIDYKIDADEVEEEPIDLIDDSHEEREEIKQEEIIDEIENDNNFDIPSIVKTEDDYITYHIHIVKSEETIETISMNYKINSDDLLKINNISEINIGDKILIPLINE